MVLMSSLTFIMLSPLYLRDALWTSEWGNVCEASEFSKWALRHKYKMFFINKVLDESGLDRK